MFIDTHSHLYLGELQHHIPEAVLRAKEHNFSHIIQIGTSVETSHTCIKLAKTYDIVKATVGIHPCEAQDIDPEKIPEQIATLEKMITSYPEHIVGFGEIGFDHYHLSSDSAEAKKQKEFQTAWFHAQANLAQKYNMAVVIHTRNCPEKTLEEIQKAKLEKFVVHCFSEGGDFAEKIFSLSPETKISFTGILTYPGSIQIQEVAQSAPLNRIMIETDAPFLIPEDKKGQAAYCEPLYTLSVYEKLCSLRKESRETIEEALWNNAVQFFPL